MKKNRLRLFLRLLSALLLISCFAIAESESGWEKKVPDSDRTRSNPVANDAAAVIDGGKLYAAKCAKCHGDHAEGKGHHPSLRTEKVQNATPGELEWLIDHGNRWHGMPGFGSLPETQRWQLVSYVKSLRVQSK